jgi:hypothetical protein
VRRSVAMVRRCGFVQFANRLGEKEFMPSVWAKEAKTKPKRTGKAARKKIAEDGRTYFKLAAGISV